MADMTALTTDHYLDLHAGKFTGTSKADLDHLFQTLDRDPNSDRLVVHFHGGNVAETEGVSIAERLLPVYRAAGAYPVFFVWHSGIGEIINDLRASFSRPLREQARAIVSRRALQSIRKLRTRHVLDLGYMLKRIAGRFVTGRSHGLRATITEEFMRVFFLTDFGNRVWRLMKHEALDAFEPDENVYGGTAFLAGLRRRWEAGQRPRIILVAHSGGSIYVCHFLEHAAKHVPDAKFDVVFLAPAVTVELFHQTVKKHSGRIANFRNFALSDGFECSDKLVPWIYPRSLLYFMSGVCEHDDKTHADLGDVPLLGMQRFFHDQRTYRNADVVELRQFLDEKERAAWSKLEKGPGLTTTTTRHVEFDQNEATVASIQHIIKNGF
ncbi:MAG: hypothetical protein K8R10_05230 [Rhodocyclales bacterium]|nr:hypothetical protein [Rhodocyclales bacterium]